MQAGRQTTTNDMVKSNDGSRDICGCLNESFKSSSNWKVQKVERDIIANITTLKLQFFIDTKITINLSQKGHRVVVTTLSRATRVEYKKMWINDNQIIFLSCDIYEKRATQSQKSAE